MTCSHDVSQYCWSKTVICFCFRLLLPVAERCLAVWSVHRAWATPDTPEPQSHQKLNASSFRLGVEKKNSCEFKCNLLVCKRIYCSASCFLARVLQLQFGFKGTCCSVFGSRVPTIHSSGVSPCPETLGSLHSFIDAWFSSRIFTLPLWALLSITICRRDQQSFKSPLKLCVSESKTTDRLIEL